MTGGFAVVAGPVEYRNSGITAFIVDKGGVVYQKDLGQTTGVAEALTTYDAGDGWSRPFSYAFGSQSQNFSRSAPAIEMSLETLLSLGTVCGSSMFLI